MNRYIAQEFPKGDISLFDTHTNKVYSLKNSDDVEELLDILNQDHSINGE